MTNSILSIMEKNIVTVDLNDSLEQVAEILDAQQLSCVPVVDAEGQCFGVISATDFLHFYHAHKNLKAERAWEVCTHQVITVSAMLAINEASEIMLDHKVHHLVVVNDNGIEGIVSSLDILKYCMAAKKSE